MKNKIGILSPWVPGHAKNILDVGTGTGNLAKALAEKFPKALITGIDLSSEILKIAQAENGLANFNFVVGNALEVFPADLSS
ncbi:class I SAM-dependent methyltransferase [Bdellovibrionales bacterium]|nr:class I SAM-dependent methyltransferase [Bdellovibrionales bacterium]